ncbi:TetR/AcrR family transcriptional regulator [Clostridium botulinum]|uniref:TetR/AcrR family transcriptional regulator n=1 Tax=Clostridium botulinum TaxID=1491 RepID=A0AAU8YT53_CLOBO|nr:TetR/AcrR family transcriptional regulator [Clostridium sporogenes]AVP63386.1 TetR/AcrR family transcriptional regulator [Clostridium botulinum]MCF4017904.1 TetR/AcrR family transcriptional regulator [Clostridium sporogenes]NFG00856.1 TetR/AcrR family transcriptional regulator [Clostridium sporogenes]NFQ66495.1 TetR/AcrR family transcriptional regulator [Clostridium sporogenes]
MVRISKDPEVRKQEILEAAMKLFYMKGYEATSMADIAKEINVVQGLCYRYFKSKQELFDIAMDKYAKECSEKFLSVICDDKKNLIERMDAMTELMQSQENNSKYHDFYHKVGNEMLHEQLMIKIAKNLIPSVSKELTKMAEKGEIQISSDDVEVVTNFIMYGQIGVLGCENIPMDEKIKEMRKFIDLLLGIKQ